MEIASTFSAKGTGETIGEFRSSDAFRPLRPSLWLQPVEVMGRLWLAALHTGAEGLMNSEQPELFEGLFYIPHLSPLLPGISLTI